MAEKKTSAKSAPVKKTTTGAKKTTPKKKATPKATVKKKVEKKAPAKTTEPEVKVPSYLYKGINEFVVGTEDYRKLIEEFNRIHNTAYNPWRVRPAILYNLWNELRQHYNVK